MKFAGETSQWSRQRNKSVSDTLTFLPKRDPETEQQGRKINYLLLTGFSPQGQIGDY